MAGKNSYAIYDLKNIHSTT